MCTHYSLASVRLFPEKVIIQHNNNMQILYIMAKIISNKNLTLVKLQHQRRFNIVLQRIVLLGTKRVFQ